jgi:zinc transporter ZupT
MRPLVLIYWTRLALSIVAGAISALVAWLLKENSSFTTFINGVTIALLLYLLSYYALKAKFRDKVEKPTKIMTMGIFMYFIAWAVFFILFSTILRGP